MSSIDGINNSATQVTLRGQQSRPDQDKADQKQVTGASAGLDKTELSEIGKELSKTTRKAEAQDTSVTPTNADEGIAPSQEKTENLLQETLGQPSRKPDRTDAQHISSAYLANSGEDQLNRLQKLLSKLAEDLSVSDDKTPTT